MNGMDDCTSIRYELGVYLLGAITPADRARVVRHLASCERCRDEVAGMAALPALLRRLPYETAAHLGADSAAPVSPDLPSAIPGSLAGRIAGRRRTRRWLTAATVAALSAAAGIGWALAVSAPGPVRAPAAAALETTRIDGVIVLTDARGLTVYWFAPDTATMSRCTGLCARNWPPVPGPVTAGAGVQGTLGTITRPDGTLQLPARPKAMTLTLQAASGTKPLSPAGSPPPRRAPQTVTATEYGRSSSPGSNHDPRLAERRFS